MTRAESSQRHGSIRGVTQQRWGGVRHLSAGPIPAARPQRRWCCSPALLESHRPFEWSWGWSPKTWLWRLASWTWLKWMHIKHKPKNLSKHSPDLKQHQLPTNSLISKTFNSIQRRKSDIHWGNQGESVCFLSFNPKISKMQSVQLWSQCAAHVLAHTQRRQ